MSEQPQNTTQAIFAKFGNNLELIANSKAPKTVNARFHRQYESARALGSIISGIGWLFVVGGGIGLLFALMEGNNRRAGVMIGAVAGVALIVFVSGMLAVVAGQVMRATVDTADYARQNLMLQVALARGAIDIDLTGEAKGETKNTPTLTESRAYALGKAMRRG